MSNSGFELRHCKVGDRLPLWQGEPFSRAALALFAGASGDHNPLHIDSDYAQAAGFDDVFVHGMFTFAFMQQCLSRIVQQEYLDSIKVRFVSIMQLAEQPVCTGIIRQAEQTETGLRVVMDLSVCNQHGVQKLTAEVRVTLPFM